METTAVCFESKTRHIHKLCGQNAEFLMLNLEVRKPTSRLWRGIDIHHDTKHITSSVTRIQKVPADMKTACHDFSQDERLRSRSSPQNYRYSSLTKDISCSLLLS